MHRGRCVPVSPAVRRAGFTLIELLVVISIIATLMALILPAIQQAREAARRTQCLSNLRNVTIAVMANATKSRDRIPAYGRYLPIPPPGVANPTPHQVECSPLGGVNWVVTCLPELDRQDIYDRWDFQASPFSTANNSVGRTNLEVLTCPDDESAWQKDGGLSYVINSGYASMANLNAYTGRINTSQNPFESQMHHYVNIPADWDGDGASPGGPAPGADADDEAINKDTGVSWIQVREDNFSHSLNSIFDGASNTLLIAENINAGFSGAWSNPNPQNCTFVYPIDASLANGANFPDPPVPYGIDGTPNAMRYGGEGTPCPSSNHPGICCFSFCDGSAKTISDTVDRRVYLQLLTSGGSRRRFTQFVPQDPLSGNDF